MSTAIPGAATLAGRALPAAMPVPAVWAPAHRGQFRWRDSVAG
jgi:hypothetical protein